MGEVKGKSWNQGGRYHKHWFWITALVQASGFEKLKLNVYRCIAYRIAYKSIAAIFLYWSAFAKTSNTNIYSALALPQKERKTRVGDQRYIDKYYNCVSNPVTHLPGTWKGRKTKPTLQLKAERRVCNPALWKSRKKVDQTSKVTRPRANNEVSLTFAWPSRITEF